MVSDAVVIIVRSEPFFDLSAFSGRAQTDDVAVFEAITTWYFCFVQV